MHVPRLKAPIVLVHGLLGYPRVRMAGVTLASYFSGIPDWLEKAGNRVLSPWLSPTAGIADRALQLKRHLDRMAPGEGVHILAHSMGGLDTRYMISRMGMGSRVLSLTTLGTPHRGTAFADWGIRRLSRLVKPMLCYLSVPDQAFYDLTRESCRKFNEQVPDDPRVRYFSVGGQQESHHVRTEWQLPYHIVLQAEGPNDGVVSLESARWGEQLDVWEGDHLTLINWLHPLGRYPGFNKDPYFRFGPLIERLAEEGF